MNKQLPQEYESRCVTGTVELRDAGEKGGAIVVGMAAVYDTLSANLGGFREVIEPGAFDETDMSDVRGLFNHDSNFVLGRTVSETLKLERTEKGLRYEIKMPETNTIRDLVEAPIRRGDVSQSSFGFIVGRNNDSWDENDEGVIIRTIHRIKQLFDVSPVTFPAYAETGVAVRTLARVRDEWEAERAGREEIRKMAQRADIMHRRAQIRTP